jgi:hypothetical protein
MTKFFYLFLLTFLLVNFGFSQGVLGVCGTNAYDNYLIKQRMLENRAEWENKVLQRGGALTYIPITYWAVAKNDGSGRVPYKNIIDNICCLNSTIYNSFGIFLYIKGIYDLNNTYIYDDPSSTLGKAYINQIMQANYNSVNVFVSNGVNGADAGVLAFYNPQGDYVVCGKKNLNSSCPTLGHEIGHFFSLAHTFFGWEGTIYNDLTMNCIKATPTTIPMSGELVEYVDRNKPGTTSGKKNCEEAADGFCDTPADYELGYGWTGGCDYNGCARDPDNVQLDPSEVNLMGYFLNCIKEFSQNQKDAILKDMLSNKRNFLRKVNYTPKAEVTDQPFYITPTNSNPAKGYDTIKFDWEDVPNADYYVFDIAENNGFNLNPKTFILTHSDTTLTNLIKNHTYYWRVTPYNSNSFCVEPRVVIFRSPAWTVASENIEINGLSSYINQLSPGESKLVITCDQSQVVTVQILNASAQIIESRKILLNNGDNNVNLDQLIPGFYLYRIINESRNENVGKFVKL